MRSLFYTCLLTLFCSVGLLGDESYSRSCSSESSDHFYCNGHHKKSDTNTYGPNLKIALTPFRLSDCSIFSIVGEGGSNNTRFSGTFGYFFSQKIRFKCTVEQLNQKVPYHFTSGKSDQWMRQLASGGVLQYAFCNPWIESVEIYGSYTECKSRDLRTHPCCVQKINLLNQIKRHVTGGRDAFGGIGATITPWQRASFSLAADYDTVNFKRKLSDRLTYSGFGGTAKLHQGFHCGVSVDLKGELRRPFNYYEGALNWTNVHAYGILKFGVYTGYTQGRGHIPNNWTTGILISADFGGMPFFSRYRNCKEPPAIRGCQANNCFPVDHELVQWVATPAVRMPTVLAISEEKVISTMEPCPPLPAPEPKPPEPDCSPPNSVTIPAQTSLPFDTSAFFDRKGHHMTFTAEGLPRDFFINPVSGILYGDIHTIGTRFVRVTGTTECGQTSETFALINEDAPYDPYFFD